MPCTNFQYLSSKNRRTRSSASTEAQEYAGSSSELSQVVPKYVDAHAKHRQDDELPEKLVDDDQCSYYRQSDVDATYQVCELASKTRLDEREQGDAGDQYRGQVLPLQRNDPDEGEEHQPDAQGGP